MLGKIEPSWNGACWHRPCRAVLRDGRIVERLLAVEDRRGFQAGDWLHPDEVVAVEESALRLPARFANRLYAERETRMGGLDYEIRYQDGRTTGFVGGSALLDFPDHPPGLGAADVADVSARAAQVNAEPRLSAKCEICYYVPAAE